MLMQNWYWTPRTTIDWADALSECRWAGSDALAHYYVQLHQQHGEEYEQLHVEVEKRIVEEIGRYEMHPRYTDALARAAGTAAAASTPSPTAREIATYLDSILVRSSAVALVYPVDREDDVYVRVDSAVMPPGMGPAVLGAMQRHMPPGITLRPLTAPASADEYVGVLPIYDIELVRRYKEPEVRTWAELLATAPVIIQKSATGKPGELRLNGRIVETPVTLHKSALDTPEWERFVLAEVMVPGELDLDRNAATKVEVRKACHWFAENSRQYEINHVFEGGRDAKPGEVVMVENYTALTDMYVQGRHIPQGTWLVGSKVYSDEVWDDVLQGSFNGYSIFASAWETLVPAQA